MTRPRIRMQAYLVGVLPLVFLVALFVLSLMMAANSRGGAALEERTQSFLSQLDAIRVTLADAGRAATAPAPGQNPAARLAKDRTQIDARLSLLSGMVAAQPGVPARLQALRLDVNQGLDLIDRYAQLRTGHPAAARSMAAAPSTRALSTRLSNAYDGVISSEREYELGLLSELGAAQRRFEIALIVTCLIGITLTLLVSGRFGLGIAKRLEHLAENARRLARGEAAETLQGHDEFSDLDRVYQSMMQRIALEQSISSTLQRRLLPQILPLFPGIRIDTAYMPATDEWDVGGDWYDVFKISDRSLCISIGDVAGHGLRAATVMAGARLAVRTAARIESDPATIMAHVNRIISADEPGTLVTACVATLDLGDGTLRYAVAGHPEPLVIRADREIEFLSGRGLLLGADPLASYMSFETQLDEGSALLLYTDGLVEIERDYFQGLNDLCEAAREEFTNSSENIAEAIQRRAFHGRRAADDAAVLFVGITRLGLHEESAEQRTWVLDARDPQSAHRAKRAILWYLGNEIQDEGELAVAELVLGELLGNVARHSPGPAEVTVDRRRLHTVLRVSDCGAPFSLNGASGETADLLAESGRGLFLARSMTQDLRVEHNGNGNIVTAVLRA